MKAPRSVLALSTVLSALATSPSFAEDGGFGGSVAPETPVVFRPAGQAAPESAPEYGTSSRTGLLAGAVNFTPRLSTTTYAAGAGGNRYLTSSGHLDFSPMFPNGAVVERIEIEACDTAIDEAVVLQYGPCDDPGAGCASAGSVSTGVLGTPGCGFFSTTLATPVVVDNPTTYHLAEVSMGTTSATRFSAVRLFYRRQVSAAPLVATFPNDVPTDHVFFRFIEALAAAGITGGCGAGSYCPNNPVTRGQMAVFLSIALGLHFPN